MFSVPCVLVDLLYCPVWIRLRSNCVLTFDSFICLFMFCLLFLVTYYSWNNSDFEIKFVTSSKGSRNSWHSKVVKFKRTLNFIYKPKIRFTHNLIENRRRWDEVSPWVSSECNFSVTYHSVSNHSFIYFGIRFVNCRILFRSWTLIHKVSHHVRGRPLYYMSDFFTLIIRNTNTNMNNLSISL